MGYAIEMACISHKGKVRDKNEDNFYFQNNILDMEHGSMSGMLTDTVTSEKVKAVAVFDGMGGENAGEADSYTAAEKFREICRIPRVEKSILLHITETLNRQVCWKAEQGRFGHIGTTATILSRADTVFRNAKGRDSVGSSYCRNGNAEWRCIFDLQRRADGYGAGAGNSKSFNRTKRNDPNDSNTAGASAFCRRQVQRILPLFPRFVTMSAIGMNRSINLKRQGRSPGQL